jgi:DNA polymerase I
MASSLFDSGASDVLVLVDMSAHVFRAYHAISPLSSPSGEPTHAVFGFVSILERLLRDLAPRRLAIAMDSGRRTFRTDIYPEYKANRPETPPDLVVQLERSGEIARCFTKHVWHKPGFEADDLIATAVRQARALGLRVLIVGADKDLMQLVGDDVRLWDMSRDRVFGPAEVREKFGVDVAQLGDYLALTGDSSDNIPGVPSVGPKTASELLTSHGTLGGIYAHLADIPRKKLRETLEKSEELARLSRRLVALREDCDDAVNVENAHYTGRDLPTLSRLYSELGFVKLASNLKEQLARDGARLPPDPTTQGAQTSVSAATGTGVTAGAEPIRVNVVTEPSSFHKCLEALEQRGTASLLLQRAESADTPSLFGGPPITGLCFGLDPTNAVWVPVTGMGGALDKGLPIDMVRRDLAALLVQPGFSLVTNGLKQLYMSLLDIGIDKANIALDLELAGYLLDPEQNHDLAHLQNRYGHPSTPLLASSSPNDPTGIYKLGSEATTLLALAPTIEERLGADGLTSLLRDIELPLSRVLARMQRRGVLVDTSHLQSLSTEISKEMTRLEQEAHTAAGHTFNVNAPRQLETILFDELGLKPQRRTKTSRSTDALTLEALSTEHPLPRILLEHRQLSKLKGTYVDTLPTLVNRQTGRVHTHWEQAVAATGRLSSTNPNLQNIPIRTELGRRIRRAFVAPASMTLVSADYSQIELRILAHLSQDPKLIQAFSEGQDVHTRTAMEVFGVGPSEVSPEMRRRAKAVNFGVIYGQTEGGLASTLGIPRHEASEFIAAYYRQYAGVRTFMNETLDQTRAGRMVRSVFGRRRLVNDIDSANRSVRLAAERMAMNMPIQATAADVLKLAMLAVDKLSGDHWPMVLTVHDELVLEIPEAEAADAIREIQRVMQEAARFSVPLVVEAKPGRSWADAH